ncbi:flagellar hook-length control protein FliK [Crenobacter luteus]|uniref:flagellar hook-length control protein FliK n=1 Tax=Crenobacter luteus TaxID=1452487 RepID=UPI0010526E57|nr:flagellar hook-length control protein FliK [Crenobacter luteus]TCP14801.1 flagellar hook-length control protein FliK [Crenobacter luteus]
MLNPIVPPPGSSVAPAPQAGPSAPQAVAAVKLLGEGSRPLIAASVLPARVPLLAVGEQVLARVAERLDGNRLVALIKGNAFTLDLPPDLKVGGDTLRLRVSQPSPSLTFVLLDAGQPAADAAGTDGSTAVQLSRSAQYLNDLLAAARERGGGAARAQGALLSLTPEQPDSLAEGLRQAVGKSGAFYESHLKDWADGRRSLAELRDEPQARLAAAEQDERASGRSAVAELGQLVQRQLDALEQRQLQLPVLAWPGQPAELTLREEARAEREADGGEGDAAARGWHTRLDLELPGLGGLSVRLALSGGAVQVRFAADDAAASSLIERHADRLASGLGAAGLHLAQLTVGADGRDAD